MSDPAETFRQMRDANDPVGNLGWSSKMARKGIKAAVEPSLDVEETFSLSDEERVLWRLMKLPRKYIDLENTGVIPVEQARGFLRALVSAELAVVVEMEHAKPIVPIEIVRLKSAVAGHEVKKGPSATLKPRVYRPDISQPPVASGGGASSSSSSTTSPRPAAEPAATKTAAEKPDKSKAPAASKPPSSSPGISEKQLIEDIERRHKQMATQNYYQFLEVQPSAQTDAIKAAYMKLAKELHPDRVASAIHDEAAAKKADALFKRLQDAWSTLNNAERRKQYDGKLGADPTAGATGSGGKVRRTDEAKVATLKADHLVKTKHIQDAEAQYKAAIILDEQYAPAMLGLAWAIFLNENRDKEQRIADAKKRLAELADTKRMADAHYKLSLIANVEGDEAEHERRVKLAAKTDPRHKEAMQELRLLQRRKNAKPQGTGADKGGGLFSKLRR